MNKEKIGKYLPLALLALFVVIYAVFYASMPDRIPVHFRGDGTPDGWMGRTIFPLAMIGIGLLLYFTLTYIRVIDPKGESLRSRRALFLYVRNLILVFIFLLGLFSMWMAVKGKVPSWSLGFLIGLLFILLGDLLPRVPANWFVGIRNPWTLSSEAVWKKTHRVGGILFVSSGFAVIVLSIAGLNAELVMSVLLIPMFVFVGLVFPFLLFIKDKKNNNKEQQ